MHGNKTYKNSNTLLIIVISVFLVVVTTIVGGVLIAHSEKTVKTVLWNHLLSVANTAAQLIDGDDVRQITQADTPLLNESGNRIQDGSARCSRIESVLIRVKNGQKDMNIPFIYVVRYENGRFVFIVDPELENPGEYGQEIAYTPSLAIAWAGEAKVDEEPYTDEWGTFYSAWSPISDSTGRIVGLVGVDFDAKEIDAQTRYGTWRIAICALVLLALSMTVVLVYSARARRRFEELDAEIDELSGNLRTIFAEIDGIQSDPNGDAKQEEYSGLDYLGYVQAKTKAMAKRLRDHIAYMQQQANVDFLTKVGNVRALSQMKEELLPAIEGKTACFAVGVFDIDGLKKINDRFGHETGDIIIKSAADALKRVFPSYDLFRIGGDEFAVVFPDATERQMELLFQLLDQEIEKSNASRNPSGPQLSLSKGYSFFDAAKDSSFADVFARADQNMYAMKNSVHDRM